MSTADRGGVEYRPAFLGKVMNGWSEFSPSFPPPTWPSAETLRLTLIKGYRFGFRRGAICGICAGSLVTAIAFLAGYHLG